MTQEEMQKYADELAQQYFPDESNIWARRNIEAEFVSEACMRMAKRIERELIEKACEWLNKTLYIHTEKIENMYCNEDGTFDYVTSDFDSVSDFIEGFRKAMEE